MRPMAVEKKIIERVVDYNDFRIVDKSDSVTAKGSYNVKLEIRKYFTPELLNNSDKRQHDNYRTAIWSYLQTSV